MEEEIILGQVCDTWIIDANTNALLEPLYFLDGDTGCWVSIDDVERKFPNRGRVTWLKADADAIEKSVWWFTCEPYPNFDAKNPKHDRYRINWDKPPKPMVEVLDLRAADADEAFRRLDQGLSLRFVPSRLVYIVLDNQSWAGPVKLTQVRGRWVLDQHQRMQPIQRVSALPKEHLEQIYVDAQRVFLRRNAPKPMKLGELDWAPDTIVLQRLLKTLRNRTDVDKSLKLTKAGIQHIVSSLSEGDHEVMLHQVARARRYLADVERVQVDLGAFETELLALPAVERRIAAAEQEGRAAAKAQAEAEAVAKARAELEQLQTQYSQLTSAVSEKRALLAELERKAQAAERRAQEAVESEMARKRQELERLDRAIAERQRQLDADLQLADAALSERLADLMRRPADALAQLAIVRAALGTPATAGAPPAPAAAHVAPPPAALLNSEPQVEDQEQVVRAARRAALATGEAPSVGVTLHSALVSGLMPLLCGPSALDVLERYAQVAAGGRMVWVTVPPVALEPADLLGRIDARTGRLTPHPGGLLDLLLYASQPEQRDRLFLAVLDGVNRAAADAYLLPILTCYGAAWDESTSRALQIVHPSALAPGDPYASAARLVWPRNVLLAGTLVEGGATVPLPPALWSQALLIPAGETRASEKSMDSTAVQRTGVPPQVWASWRTRVDDELQQGVTVLDEVNADRLHLPASIARAFARAFAAIRPSHRDERQALKVAARGILVPYALATGQAEALRNALEETEIKLDERELAGVEQVVL